MKTLHKFVIILLLFLYIILNNINSYAYESPKIDYTETLETFDNPERGYYSHLRYNFKVEGNEVPEPYRLEGNLIHLRFGIGDFSKKVNGHEDLEFSSDMLNMLDKILKQIKANGGTVIVRFAYDNFDGDEDLEPSLDMILKHIQQICPILTENKDVISYVELGFFGPWGEMHSSKICTPENVSKAINVMLENTPEEIKIGVRQPKYYVGWLGIDRNLLNENVTEKGTPAYRVGLFNDGYLGSHSDLGTFENREIEIQWLEKQALHTLYGGEIVSTRTSHGNEQIDTINTVEYMSKEAFRTHTTYLNSEYDEKVFDAWKKEIYTGEDELYKGKSGYLYITNHLGYRFVLRNSEIQKINNEKLNINLDIENVGFANLVNSKKITFVLENDKNMYEIETNIDPTIWNSTQLTNVNTEIQLPSNIEEGEYNVYLRISKYGDLKTDNNYQCIRLANNNIWNKDICANYVGTFVFENLKEDDNTPKPSTPDDSNTPSDSNNTVDPTPSVPNDSDNAPDSNNTVGPTPSIPDDSDKPSDSNNTVSPTPSTPNNSDTPTISNNNKQINKNEGINKNKINYTNSIKDYNVVNKNILPQTGISQSSILIIMIVISFIFTIYFYKKQL